METTSIFPTTEAWKQSVEILNAEIEIIKIGGLSESAASLLVDPAASHTSNKNSTAAEKVGVSAIAFIFRQLLFHGLQSSEEVIRALTQPILLGKTSFSLDKKVADAISATWMAHGKSLTQSARQETINQLCRKDANAEKNFIAVDVDIVMAQGLVEESTAERDGLDYRHVTTLHDARSRVLLPPTEHHPNGTVISMSKKETYDLFAELDKIQKSIDNLIESAH